MKKIAVITGDIINSKQEKVEKWLFQLRQALNRYGEEPQQWEIFRGDSFQLEMPPEEALRASIYVKASIKQFANLDVRMAIGIGKKSYSANKVTESNGSAFIFSGECFEALKKQTLAIKSIDSVFDEQVNLYLLLALLTMDNWTVTESSIIKTVLENPELKQEEISKMLKKAQSSISEALKRGGFYAIRKMEKRYQSLLKDL